MSMSMSSFFEIVSVAASMMTIAGITLKDFLPQTQSQGSDKVEIEKYIVFLQSRDVLLAPIDYEVQSAVIRSIEEIKQRTERLREDCTNECVKTILLELLLVMSKQLNKLHKLDATTKEGKYKMYCSLQILRFQFAQTLAFFCTAFGIDPKNTRLEDFILNFSTRPRV